MLKNIPFCLYLVGLSLIIALISCEDSTQNNKLTQNNIPLQADTLQNLLDTNTSPSKKNLYQIKYFLKNCPKDSSQVAIFDETTAISIAPNDIEIKELQKKLGKNYDEMLEDYTNSLSELKIVLDANKIKIQTTTKRYLKFVGKNKKEYCIDTYQKSPDSLTLRWNLVAFHLQKPPIVLQQAPANPEEIQKYFEVK
jgi:hypothetical protein